MRRNSIDILDLEYKLLLNHEGGPAVMAYSKSLNIHCAFRLVDEHLKEYGLKGFLEICEGVKKSLCSQYEKGLIGYNGPREIK